MLIGCACASTVSCEMHPGNTGTYRDQQVNRALWDLITASIRRPSDGSGTTFTFTPALSAAEQATLDALLAAFRAGLTDIPQANYAAVKAGLQTLRAIRQPGRNAFMALTAAERDRLCWDAIDAILTVLLAQLREPESGAPQSLQR